MLRMNPILRSVLLGTLSFVAAAAIAFAVGRAFHGEDTPSAALPALEAPEPVVTPIVIDDRDVATMVMEQAEQNLFSRQLASDFEVVLDPGEPGSSASAGVSGTRLPDDPDSPGGGAPGPSESAGTAGTPVPGDADSPGGGDPVFIDAADGPPSDSPPATEVALDECADGGDGCPDGVGGTILLAIRDLPPLAGVAVFNPAATRTFGWEPVCPAVDVPGGSAYFGFSTSRPVSIRFEYRAYPRVGGAYLAEGVLDFYTAPEDEGPWNDWIADDTAPADDPRSWINHCVLIPDLPPSAEYYAFISYFDRSDSTVSAANWQRPVPFEVADDRGFVPGEQRRPTFLLGYGIDDLRIGATRTPEQLLEAVALEGAAPGSCNTGGDEASVIGSAGAIRSRVLVTNEIPATELTDPTYPFLPEHSISTVLQLGLVEGTDYLVCLYWLGPGSTFDARVVEIAEEVPVSTPEAYRPRIKFHGVSELFGSLDRASVSIWPCGSVGMDVDPRHGGGSQLLPEPIVMCTAEMGLTELDRGIRVVSSIHETFDDVVLNSGRFIRTDLECHVTPCLLKLDEMALVPLPEVPTERRLCGSGFGGGCSGEVPRRISGYAVVEIEYINVPGNGLTRWSIGEAGEFVDTPPPPVGDTPLLDVQTNISLASHPINGANVEVTVVADRPVTMAAALIGAIDCGLPLPGSYSGETLATTHTFALNQLCLGNEYQIEVIAFDASGAQGTIVERLAGEVGSTTRLVVPPVWMRLDISVTVPPPDGDHWHTAYVRPVTVGVPTVVPAYGAGLDWSWPVDARAAAAAAGWQMFGLHGQANACGRPDARPFVVSAESRGALLSQDQITITAVVDIHRNHPASPVYSECAVAALETSHLMQATVSVSDLFEGVTITSDGGAVFSIRAVTFRPELYGG